MKRKFADARNVKDIKKSTVKTIYLKEKDFEGWVSGLKIIDVNNKWCVDEENRCVLDKNYFWLEIYPKNKNYCITAIYDEKKILKEWYIDVSKKIGVLENIPYEDDLFLDVVIVPDGRIHLLDEEELKEALEKKEIDLEDYNLAYKIANYLIEEYGQNIDKITNLTNKLLKKLSN